MTAALAFAAAALAVIGLADLLAAGRGGSARKEPLEEALGGAGGEALGGAGGAALGGEGEAALQGARGGARREARAAAAGGSRFVRLLARLGSRLRPSRLPASGDLAARIAAAGGPGGLGVREVMAAKAAAAVGGGVVAAVLSGAAPGRLGIALVVTGPLAGFLVPDLWLARRAAERGRRARAELPALLDLLRVSVEAGSSLPKALHDVGARAGGPLAAEWRALGREVALGVPLDAALRRTVERLPLPEVRSLVAALERARRHGAPLADTLASQARDARFALARHAREEAARAGPKIQLVVALLLVPSVLLLVAAALAAALLEGGGAAFPV
jgi:tight adherence protein C